MPRTLVQPSEHPSHLTPLMNPDSAPLHVCMGHAVRPSRQSPQVWACFHPTRNEERHCRSGWELGGLGEKQVKHAVRQCVRKTPAGPHESHRRLSEGGGRCTESQNGENGQRTFPGQARARDTGLANQSTPPWPIPFPRVQQRAGGPSPVRGGDPGIFLEFRGGGILFLRRLLPWG